MFTLGYNTNGLAHHRLEDSMELLAELGYGALALTPDVGQLDPFRASSDEISAVANRARDLDLAIVIETGARFVMDARRKHFPTLLEADPADRTRRLDFLRRCVDMAVELGAPLVSIWAGAAHDGATAGGTCANQEEHWDHLCEGLDALLRHAGSSSVQIALEPEPGMFLERPAEFRQLRKRLGAAGNALGMTLDVGHLVVTGDLPVEDLIVEYSTETTNVHLDDCPRGVHLHGFFGTGDLDLQAAISALIKTGYTGVASVELSRDSHRGPFAAEQALRQLERAIEIGS